MLLAESNRGASVLHRPIRRTPIEPLTVSSSSPRVAAEEAEAAVVAEAAAVAVAAVAEPAAAVLAPAVDPVAPAAVPAVALAVPAVALAVPAVALVVPAVALVVPAVAVPAPAVRAQAVAVERVRVPGGDPAAVPDPALVARQRDRAPESAAAVRAKGQSLVTGPARRRVRLE
jgi:hypothetical protein